MKKNILTILIVFSFSILMSNSIVFATTTTNKKNIDLVIVFKDNNIDEGVEGIVTNSGGEIVKEFPELGGIEVNCAADLIPTIKSKDSVQSLAPNHIIKLSNETTKKFSELEDKVNSNGKIGDLYEKYQWDIKRVTNNGESFNLESGNHNIVVGIIDSGVDTNHPDLVDNFLGGKNLVPVDFDDDSSETGEVDDVTDRLGHGTNVAGIIAANGRTKGVAPDIGFKSYRIFDEDGNTNATICSSAIMAATDDGVNVINLSIGAYDLKGKCYWTDKDTGIEYKLGSDMAEYSLYKRAIKYAIKHGVTVVASAGNESQDCSDKKKLTNYLNDKYSEDGFRYDGLTYEAPGTVKGVITVAATDKHDKLASYSNYGDDFIDISGPGGDISEDYDFSDMCLTTNIHSKYTFTVGTSSAAPKVSAAAALILCKNENLTPKEVGKKMYKTADKLDNGNSSRYYGAGIINAYNAIQKTIDDLK